jgi:hypothetical protein
MFIVLVTFFGLLCNYNRMRVSCGGRLTVIFGLLFGGIGGNKTLFLCLMKYVPKHVLKKMNVNHMFCNNEAENEF